MDKLGRNYALYIQEQEENVAIFNNSFNSSPLSIDSDGFLLVQPPLTVEFDIQRNILSSANAATIRIYNLSELNRFKIFKPQVDFAQIKQIQLQAGYGPIIPVIFNGNIIEAWSVREGTNYITQCDCLDGGFAFVNGVTNQNFPPGTKTGDILNSLLDSLPGVSKGAVGDYNETSPRGSSYSGSTTDIARELSGGGFFIDNGKAHCLKDDECIEGQLEVINSDSGLLGTPQLEGGVYVSVQIMFEPRILIGQRIVIDSITSKNYNSEYKVVGIHHKGLISESVCGEAVTTLKLFNGLKSLKVVS